MRGFLPVLAALLSVSVKAQPESEAFPGESYEADLLSALALWRVQSAARIAEARRTTPVSTFLDEAAITERLVAAGITLADAERITEGFGDDLSQCPDVLSVWRSGNRMDDPCILDAARQAGITAELVNALPPVTPRPQPEGIDARQFYQDFGGERIARGGLYPERAAKFGQEGWVLIEFSAGSDGCITAAQAVDASPSGYFEEAALAPLTDRCFNQPKMVDGEAVAVENYPLLFTFLLDP